MNSADAMADEERRVEEKFYAADQPIDDRET